MRFDEEGERVYEAERLGHGEGQSPVRSKTDRRRDRRRGGDDGLGGGLLAAESGPSGKPRAAFTALGGTQIQSGAVSSRLSTVSAPGTPGQWGPAGTRRSPRRQAGTEQSVISSDKGSVELSVELDGKSFALRAPDLEGAAWIHAYAGRLLEDMRQIAMKLKEGLGNA